MCMCVTVRYVAPEYANTSLLNEKSDLYSFGVLPLEAITVRDPVDYQRPANEVEYICLDFRNVNLMLKTCVCHWQVNLV